MTKRQTRTVSSIAATTLATLACATVSRAGGPEYEFFLVTSFNPSYALAETYVYDINENNMALGNDTFGGFRWTEQAGKIQLPFQGARSINNQGYVAFSQEIYNPATGIFTPIPSPSSQFPNISPSQLNDNMVLVGSSSHGGPGCEPLNCPFDCGSSLVWTQKNGSSHITNVSGLKPLFRVNNQDIAIGMIITGCDNNRGIVYDLHTGEWINLSDPLEPVALLGIPAQTWPADISDAGHVIGDALFGSQPSQEFIWTEEDGYTFLPPIDGGNVSYMDSRRVNVHGHVVGMALHEAQGEWKAFIWDAQNGTRDLNNLVQGLPSNFILNDARAINDNGWIVGSGHFGPGWATQRGFVLKPIAPPQAPGDITGNGVVDVDDLLAVINAWGACPAQGECAADIAPVPNGNGFVDVDDLLMVINNWG